MRHVFVVLTISSLAIACGSGPSQNQNASALNSNRTTSAEGAPQLGNTTTPIPAPTEPTVAIDGEKVVRVRFASGKYDATYTDDFALYGTVDFVFDAKAGQQLTVEIIRSDGNVAILTVMRNGQVIADDASEVQGWTGDLPANGNYTVRVGQMRNDARRSKDPVKFTIKITIV